MKTPTPSGPLFEQSSHDNVNQQSDESYLYHLTDTWNLFEQIMPTGIIGTHNAYSSDNDVPVLIKMVPWGIPLSKNSFSNELTDMVTSDKKNSSPVILRIDLEQLTKNTKVDIINQDLSQSKDTLDSKDALMFFPKIAIPLTACSKIIFSTENHRDEFISHSFSNIWAFDPNMTKVDSNLFSSGTVNKNDLEKISSGKSDGSDKDLFSYLDRVAGAVSMMYKVEDINEMDLSLLFSSYFEFAPEVGNGSETTKSIPEWFPLMSFDKIISKSLAGKNIEEIVLNLISKTIFEFASGESMSKRDLLKKVRENVENAEGLDKDDLNRLCKGIDKFDQYLKGDELFEGLTQGTRRIEVLWGFLFFLLTMDPDKLLSYIKKDHGATRNMILSGAFYSGFHLGLTHLPIQFRNKDLDQTLQTLSCFKLTKGKHNAPAPSDNFLKSLTYPKHEKPASEKLIEKLQEIIDSGTLNSTVNQPVIMRIIKDHSLTDCINTIIKIEKSGQITWKEGSKAIEISLEGDIVPEYRISETTFKSKLDTIKPDDDQAKRYLDDINWAKP